MRISPEGSTAGISRSIMRDGLRFALLSGSKPLGSSLPGCSARVACRCCAWRSRSRACCSSSKTRPSLMRLCRACITGATAACAASSRAAASSAGLGMSGAGSSSSGIGSAGRACRRRASSLRASSLRASSLRASSAGVMGSPSAQVLRRSCCDSQRPSGQGARPRLQALPCLRALPRRRNPAGNPG